VAEDRAWLSPLTLAGRYVRLEPLELDHLPALCAVGLDPDLWRWTVNMVSRETDMRDYVEAALASRARGTELPFVTIERASGTVVGSTRYLAAEPAHRRLEIGYTWVASGWQRTALNSEAKLLMLGHAFGPLGCNRVEFKTDSLNEKSRAALLRIGAVEEGTFRNHMVSQGGRLRHTVYFSIIRQEWPAVRHGLEARLARHPSS
jgi:N-acetyltransferase